MNVFKRKSIYLAVAAGLGAVGMAGTASAVNINSNGLGQVLIYPYYTVRGGADTYLSVVNTTNSVKAVKVRFTEGKNSREVLDFNLYLSPNDVWTGAVVATTAGAKLVTTDKSCTAPAIPAAGVDFVNYAYASGAVGPGIVTTMTDNQDGESTSLDRTREGYFEIIEMGVVTNATIAAGVTHSSAGTPANCGVVTTAAMTALPGMGTGGGASALVAPQGGLTGTATLINVAAGVDASYDPVALAYFSNVNIWDAPGSVQPDLTKASPATSVVFKGGAAITSNWTAFTADAVSSLLMHDNVINEFVLDTATLSGTDWVVTMPTKRYYVPVDATPTASPTIAFQAPAVSGSYFAVSPFTQSFYTGGACEPVSLAYYNREEGTVSSGIQFSPMPAAAGNALCWESTVVTFNNSNVLSSSNVVNVPISSTMQNGWLKATFNTATGGSRNLGHYMQSTDAVPNTFRGLPVTGFMVRDFVNGNVGGVLSNYAGNFSHKGTTLINGSSVD